MLIRSAHLNVMTKAAEKAGRMLVRDFGEVEQLQVSRKGPGDFVSTADQKAERTIIEELTRARPWMARRISCMDCPIGRFPSDMKKTAN